MNEQQKSELESGEPLHAVAEQTVTLLVHNRGPLTRAQADDIENWLVRLPDEELADAVFSLTRVAGYFHDRLGNAAVAAQLLDLCFDMTLQLNAVAERLRAKRIEIERTKKRAYQRLTDGDKTLRAPGVGPRPTISVNTLRPRTKFA